MEKYRKEFEKGLTEFVDELKKYVSTETGDWTIKGFIDIYKIFTQFHQTPRLFQKYLKFIFSLRFCDLQKRLATR